MRYGAVDTWWRQDMVNLQVLLPELHDTAYHEC